MQPCLKCGGLDFKVEVLFKGSIWIGIGSDGEFEVTDSESRDSEWTDESDVECLACGWSGMMKDIDPPTPTDSPDYVTHENRFDPPAPAGACEDKGLTVDPIVMSMMGPVGASIMHDEDRKHGLRAAVKVKVDANREQAWSLPGGITYSSYDYHVALLWQIIDSLVDECARCPICDGTGSILLYPEDETPASRELGKCPHCGGTKVRPADKKEE